MAQMIQMISKQSHRYAGRVLHEGEKFECEERHVPGLIALQRAEVSRDMQAAPAAEYLTREMKPGRGRRHQRRGS